MVARVRPSLDPFRCGRPEIYSGMAPIMAHLHACHNVLDAFATTPPRQARAKVEPAKPLVTLLTSGLSTG
jgi:hypothetical protein